MSLKVTELQAYAIHISDNMENSGGGLIPLGLFLHVSILCDLLMIPCVLKVENLWGLCKARKEDDLMSYL